MQFCAVSTDVFVLNSIKSGYKQEQVLQEVFAEEYQCAKVLAVSTYLWYVGDRLLIPRVGDIRENLFRLAHDTAGHFGADKSYALLRDAYYWPNMCRDLEQSYIPSCADCQRNKSSTKKPCGPLHPLPIPDTRGDSVAMDFIGPLPLDSGYDCILPLMDHLNSDV